MAPLRLILGQHALPVSLSAARADAMLWSQAMALYEQSPAGSVLELRAALVLIGLLCDPLRAATLALAATTGYDVPRLGGAVWGVLESSGAAPLEAVAAVSALLTDIAERARPAAAPSAPVAPHPIADIPDPYPGLKRHGETYPVFAIRLAGKRDMDAENERVEWRAAGMAHDEGRIVAWVAEVGASLGFSYEAPGPSEAPSAG